MGAVTERGVDTNNGSMSIEGTGRAALATRWGTFESKGSLGIGSNVVMSSTLDFEFVGTDSKSRGNTWSEDTKAVGLVEDKSEFSNVRMDSKVSNTSTRDSRNTVRTSFLHSVQHQ